MSFYRNKLVLLLTFIYLSASCIGHCKEKLAIVDFEIGDVKGKDKDTGKTVAGIFGTALSNKYILLERMQINKIIAEQRFSLSDLVSNNNNACKLGTLLGTDKLVVGNVAPLGESIVIYARVVDVNSGEWSENASVECKKIDEIYGVLPTLLAKMNLLSDNTFKDSRIAITLKNNDSEKIRHDNSLPILISAPRDALLKINGKNISLDQDVTLNLSKGNYPFSLHLPGQRTIYGIINVYYTSELTNSYVFGNGPDNKLFPEKHIEHVLTGAPVKYNFSIMNENNEKIIAASYTLSLNKILK